jgi:YHS domain-containing protein
MKTVIACCVLGFVATGFSQTHQVDTLTYCLTRNQVGIGGYDAVSYFLFDKPVLGKAEYATNREGVEYRFASEANKKTFLGNPKKYLPQFGGWCSMTLAMGRATTPTYDNFAILSGQLYLFERTVSVNGRELWLKDPKSNEKVATSNYKAYRTTGRIK